MVAGLGRHFLLTNIHSRISLVASDIFVSENWKKKSNSKFLHLFSETAVSGGHLHQQVLVEGFCEATNQVWTFLVGGNFVIIQ